MTEVSLAVPTAEVQQLRLVTCGCPMVQRTGEPVAWPAQSAAELLWYLHAHPQGVYRAQLLAELWGAEASSSVLGRFRVALHRLRSVLGGPWSVLEQEGRYQLHPAVYARSDVAEQAKLLEQAEAVTDADQRCKLLAQAADAVDGVYLPQFEAAWVQAERSRVQEVQLKLALRLSRQQCQLRLCGVSLDTLQATLQREPLLDEREHQRLLVCLATQQGSAAALEHYRRYVRYLRQEVDDTPLPETRALAERVREEQIKCHWRSIDASAESPPK